MSASTHEPPDGFDHSFKAIHDHEVEWESDDVRGLLRLPPSVQERRKTVRA